MNVLSIRDVQPLDYPTIVDINAAEVQHTSPMDRQRLQHLDQLSAYHRVVEVAGTVVAFLLALREHASYENENYDWFSSRYSKFLYIDRVVVNRNHAGLKIGTMLYQDIFSYARAIQVPYIACEYNLIPANEPSRHFHDKLGFSEVGSQWLANGTKKVSMQVAEIGDDSLMRTDDADSVDHSLGR